MIRIIKRGTDQIVHGRIDDDEILVAGALYVFDARDENTGVATDEAAWFNKNFHAQWLEKGNQPFGILGGSEYILGFH